MEARQAALRAIVAEMRPMTVRQVFYQATVRGIVEKEDSGYRKVQGDLANMRKNKTMPYGWLADNTRWQRKPKTFDGIEEALQNTAELYRKNLWADSPVYAEIWLEKDAISGVVYPVTSTFDVPLMVSRGYASLSFLHNAAEDISDQRKPAFIYHLGDYDPSGVNAGESIERSLREMAPDAEIYIQRLAVTPQQIEEWSLPTRPTKKTDTRSKGFSEISVELDAIPPDDLRALVQAAIEQHMSGRRFDSLMAAEESERELLKMFGAEFTAKYDCGRPVSPVPRTANDDEFETFWQWNAPYCIKHFCVTKEFAKRVARAFNPDLACRNAQMEP
jgi:hypothetical protein